MFLMGGNLEALGSDNTTVGEEILLQAIPQPRHDTILHFRFLLQAHAPPEIHPLHLSENCTGKESTNRFSDCNSFISFLSTNTNVFDFYPGIYSPIIRYIYFISVADSDPNPDPSDPYVMKPPGSGSSSQRYGSGSFDQLVIFKK